MIWGDINQLCDLVRKLALPFIHIIGMGIWKKCMRVRWLIGCGNLVCRLNNIIL